MNRFIASIGLVMCIFITSCVPYKNTLYLNENQPNSNSQILVEKPQPYRLQISDVINIVVKASDERLVAQFNPTSNQSLDANGQESAYFDGFTIDLQGNIRIPVLGKMKILGYTTEEVEKIITDKLNETEFKDAANIFVTVKLAGFRYTVNGEIGNPGTQVLLQDRVNILEAIANAGEIPITGDKTDVLIIRQYPQGQKIHHIDLTDVSALNSPFYYLQPNDIISIKPLKQKSLGTGTNTLQTITTIVSLLSLVTTSIILIDRF